jgi:hypothetical protein
LEDLKFLRQDLGVALGIGHHGRQCRHNNSGDRNSG